MWASQLIDILLQGNDAIAEVKNWLDENGFELAAHKMEAVLISRKRNKETAEFRLGNFKAKTQVSTK